jgi:hypothetical protein
VTICRNFPPWLSIEIFAYKAPLYANRSLCTPETLNGTKLLSTIGSRDNISKPPSTVLSEKNPGFGLIAWYRNPFYLAYSIRYDLRLLNELNTS